MIIRYLDVTNGQKNVRDFAYRDWQIESALKCGTDIAQNENDIRTRLKEKLLAQFADSCLHEQSDGKRVVFIFAEGIQNMLKETLMHRDYTRLSFLQKLPISEEIFKKKVNFFGCFSSDYQDQYNYVPRSNQMLNSAILYGSKMHNEDKHSQSCLTIAHLLSRNCEKRTNEESVPDYEFPADNLICPSNEWDSSRLVHYIIWSMVPASA